MKIALFGGSFNPIHIGHIKLAKYTIDKLKLDKLIFIPAYKSVEKINIFYEDANMRCEMIKKVMFDKTELSTYEIDLAYPVPSFITVKHFAQLYPNDELYFLIGEDCLSTLETWEGIEDILKLTKVIVWKRYNNEKFKTFDISSKLHYLDNPIHNYSSSSFRLRKDKRSLLVDKKVLDFIEQNQLYQSC